MSAPTLSQRRAAIRYPVATLAVAARVDVMTAHRVLRGIIDPRQSTVAKIEDALAAEERRLFDYLAQVVPPIADAAE